MVWGRKTGVKGLRMMLNDIIAPRALEGSLSGAQRQHLHV